MKKKEGYGSMKPYGLLVAKKLALIAALATAVAYAGDPTPESETDLPAGLTSALNGLALREGMSGLVKTAADDMGAGVTVVLSEKQKAKKCFLYAAAKLLEVVDDSRLTDLLKQLGYTIWTGSGENREIYIKGFFNEDTTLTPNDVIDTLYEVLWSRINYAITEKTTYHDGVFSWTYYSLADFAADGDWKENFDLDYSILGAKLFESEFAVDRGDAYAVIGALRAVEGILYFLKGQDLSAVTIPELLDIIVGFMDLQSPTFEEIFAKIDSALRKLSVRSTSNLTTSRSKIAGGNGDMIEYLKNGDAWIRNTRSDSDFHLIGRLSAAGENPGHAIAYDPNDPIISLIRNHTADIRSMFNNSGTSAPTIQKSWFADVFTFPDWVKRDSYKVSLKPLFSSVKWAEKLPVFDGDWVVSIPDPTFAGILPDLTKAEAEEAMVAISVTGFDDPLIAQMIETGEYAEFRTWAAKVSSTELRASPYAYQSYGMRTAVEPHVFMNEPKVEIGGISAGTSLQIKVKVTDGDSLVRAVKAIEESVQVCTDLSSPSWGKATATATVNDDGTATVMVTPPKGKAGFIRMNVK